MDTNELFALYGKVQKEDKEAKKKFVTYYATKFPNNKFIYEHPSKENLHTMYLHLTL